jgi:ATP-dependent Clp protease ATP-binding subunit ClpX
MAGIGSTVKSLKCAFCGRDRARVGRLVVSRGTAICDGCIAALYREADAAWLPAEGGPSPRHLLAELDRRIVGQDAAKRVLAVAGYRHFRRRQHRRRHEEDGWLPKANILLVGPSGSGKTRLVETLGRVLSVPFASIDVMALTRTGYAGRDVASIAGQLLDAANDDPEEARFGIVHLEGVDKLAAAFGPDVAGAGVQQELLGMLEGAGIVQPQERGGMEAMYGPAVLETADVLFLASGVFEGIGRIVADRCGRDRPCAIEPVDLIAFGLLPEFVGRFPIVVELEAPGESDLLRMLTEPEDAPLNQYRALLAMSGVRLEAAPEALRAIAGEALRRGTGARALRAVFEAVLLDVMFEAPSMRGLRAVRLEGAEFGALRCVLSFDRADCRAEGEPAAGRRTVEGRSAER